MNKVETTTAAAQETATFANARIVLADKVIEGHLTVADGFIVAIESGIAPVGSQDLGGDYMLPGLVDIHTDHFEKHVFPRAHVRWDVMRAALAHDAQIVGSGITTVFDSICVGATIKNPERLKLLTPMVDALEEARAADMLRSDHLVHLRCEITDEAALELTRTNIGKDIVRMVSVMEHLPGRRQSRDVEAYIGRRMAETGHTRALVEKETEKLLAQSDEISRRIRPQIVALAHEHALPVLSHDDTDVDHVEEAVAEGIQISEFPCTVEAARRARHHNMTIVGGAPNVLRGGSQSGNVSVKDLLAENLVDILASDYVPRSMLDAIFMIADDESFEQDLSDAARMVSKNPAEAAGLSDRGEIAVGKRADLLHVGLHDTRPFLKQVLREGKRVA